MRRNHGRSTTRHTTRHNHVSHVKAAKPKVHKLKQITVPTTAKPPKVRAPKAHLYRAKHHETKF